MDTLIVLHFYRGRKLVHCISQTSTLSTFLSFPVRSTEKIGTEYMHKANIMIQNRNYICEDYL